MEEISLREYILMLMQERDARYEQRFVAQEKASQSALAAAREAVLKAETATEKRFEGVNEFRKTLSDQTNTFMPRAEYTVQHVALNEKVDAIAAQLTKRIEDNQKAIAESINSLNISRGGSEGRSIGLNAGFGYLVGAVGVITSIIILIVKLH